MSKKFWTSLVVCLFATAILGGGVYTICNYEKIKEKIQNGSNGSHKPVDPSTPIDPNFPLTFIVKFLGYEKDEIQTVAIGDYAKQPSVLPQKKGYKFKGWLYNGQPVKVEDIVVNQNITFEPMFVKIHIVTYKIGEETGSFTRENGYKLNLIDVYYEIPEGFVLDGWKYNNLIISPVEINDIEITSDTYIEAILTRFYQVTFSYKGHIKKQNVIHGEFAQPFIPEQPAVKFVGWYVGDVLVEDFENYPITQDTIFVAKYVDVDMVKLELSFTDEQKQIIFRHPNPSAGGVGLEIKDIYYCQSLNCAYVFVRGVDKKTNPVYTRYEIKSDNLSEVTAEFIVNEICIQNNPKVEMGLYRLASDYSQEYFDTNKDNQYNFDDQTFMLKNIYVSLNSSYSTKEGITRYYYYIVAINDNGELVIINQKEGEDYAFEGTTMTDKEFCSILFEKYKIT